MPRLPRFRLSLSEQVVALAAFGTVLFYTYIQFFQMPYIGFDLARSIVSEVNVSGDLQVGDELIQFGDVPMARFNADWRIQLLDDLQTGSVIRLVVRRGGLIHTVQWVVPGITRSEFVSRLSNQWWLAIVFGVMGLLTLLGVRPKDERWRLLAAFSLLTALWLGAGSVSRWHLAGSIAVLDIAMWLCLPVYIHLHWVFPKPLRPISPWVWRVLYTFAALALVAGLANWVPITTSSLGAAVGALGALFLLILRYVFRPEQQRETGLLLVGGLLTFMPTIILGFIDSFLSLSSNEINFSLLGLIALPLIYFYVAYRRQLGNFELRANGLLGAYLFFLFLGLLISLSLSALEAWTGDADIDLTARLLLTLSAAVVGAVGLQPFQRLVDRRLLGISIPPATVTEVFTNRLATRLNTRAIAALLTGEILPSLLIRQSALYRLVDGKLTPLYTSEVHDEMQPKPAELSTWLTQSGTYLPPTSTPQPLEWVRLVLPITIEKRLIGLWLFGHRDPDDFYGQEVIKTLQLLANQAAIALTNITQAEQLFTLNQIHIKQYEAERVHIARELHDEVLNDLSPLADGSEPAASLSPERAALVVAKIRGVISGLRPLSLNYGLYYGLQALFDELEGRHGQLCELRFAVTGESTRYDPATELHIYRIIQQACDNAIKHGRPRCVQLQGELGEAAVFLAVEDDGLGFATAVNLDLAHLLATKHFGIAGMLERASILGASLTIHSTPASCTRLELRWPAAPQ